MKTFLLFTLFFLAVAEAGYSQTAQEETSSFHQGKAALLIEHDYKKAIKYLTDALSIESDHEKREESLNLLAEAYWGIGDTQRAIKYFQEEISYGKSVKAKPVAVFRLGMLHSQIGETAKAIAAFEIFANDYPNHPWAPSALIIQANYLLIQKGNRRKAIDLYERLSKRYPDSRDGKTALLWLPNLRKMSDKDFETQRRKLQEEASRMRKMKKRMKES